MVADHVCVSGDQLSTSKASLLFAPKQNGNALIVKYLIRSSLTKVCSRSIHPRRKSILTHSCHVGEMNNRTFVGDIQVSDLAPENSTFVQTQGATLYRHLYKHRRRHYNVTVTWRHYYIRLVFPRHDKWQETDDEHYLYSPSSDILMGAIFSSAATSVASRLPLQYIASVNRWTSGVWNTGIQHQG